MVAFAHLLLKQKCVEILLAKQIIQSQFFLMVGTTIIPIMSHHTELNNYPDISVPDAPGIEAKQLFSSTSSSSLVIYSMINTVVSCTCYQLLSSNNIA